MSPVLPTELSRRQAGVLRRDQLRSAGWSDASVRRAVERGELRAVGHRALLVAAVPPTWNQRAWVALAQAAPGAVISHRSASQLHRVGRISVSAIDVAEPEATNHGASGPSLHRTTALLAEHTTVVDGLPVTTLARTIFDLAGLVSPARRRRGLPSLTAAQVERALDDALVRGLALGQLEQVLAVLGGRGRPGTVLTRDLVEERSDGRAPTASELEDLVRCVLRTYGVPDPDRQVPLGAEDRTGFVDFAYRRERVVIEADGRQHHTALLDAEHDRWRDLRLAADGYVVVRITQRQLRREPARFATGVLDLLARRADLFA
jgi:very-short-patch-repair endonuclease